MEGPQAFDERLTSSSRTALDWATWLAAERGGASLAPTSSSRASPPTADALDLLLGILLAHPAASEPRQLLDYFEIPLGALRAALPADHQPDLATLPHGAPSRQPDVELGPLVPVLDLAGDLAKQSGADEGLVRIADLFGGLLSMPGQPAANLLEGLLDSHGARVTIAELAGEYPRYLAGLPSVTYRDYLSQAHPWAPKPALIAAYDADAVRPATSDSDVDAEPAPPQDLVGIGPEVDAFAYLVASRPLIPPLAIGLFGNWGSGKSFFMQALQRRVDRITEWARRSGVPQRDLLIHKNVVQIDFNAWHYVEGNLWASLVDHIFNNLRTSPRDRPGLLEQRREHVTAKIASAQLARQTIEAEIHAERERLAKAQEDRKALEASQLAKRRELETQAKAVADELAHDLGDDVGALLEHMGYPQAGASVADLAAAIAETRAVLQRGTGVVRRLQDGGLGWMLVIVGLIALAPIVSLVLAALNVPTVTTVLASIAAVLGGAVAVVRQGAEWSSAQLAKLEKAEQEVQKARATLEEQRLEADRSLASIEAELRAMEESEQVLNTRLVELQRELQAITPAKVLSDFIDARVGSDDYRKHLGLTALVRRDFEDLWRLIAKEEEDFLESDTGTGQDQSPGAGIGRIVLYIDDLDRCPPHVVVNVLQAIHLLLAFPLFVVVVAVDARWLSSSLEKHYGRLLGGFDAVGPPKLSQGAADPDHQATPDDYLEKIFQIPFWVRPLDRDSRSRIVRGLVSPTLAAERSATVTGSVIGEAVPSGSEDPAIATLVRLMAQGDQPKLHPQSLEITGDELEFMQVLSPLLGDSPRSVKRFVNVYRLMKSLAESADAAFMTGAPHAGFKLVLFLGAVVTGMPKISAELFRSIREPRPGRTTLAEFAREISGTSQGEAATLLAWLQDTDGGTWGAVKLSDLVPWSAQLARFSFRSEVT